ncbi:MAG: hypothetical protein ACREAC_19095, partial [Blastocatellia bacterium]
MSSEPESGSSLKTTLGVIVPGEDITDRRLAEAWVRDREERIRMLVEQVPAVLWSTDDALRVTSSSGSALAAMNEVPGESAGKSLFDLLNSSEEHARVIAAHQNALKGESSTYELAFKGRE